VSLFSAVLRLDWGSGEDRENAMGWGAGWRGWEGKEGNS